MTGLPSGGVGFVLIRRDGGLTRVTVGNRVAGAVMSSDVAGARGATVYAADGFICEGVVGAR